MKAIDRIYPHLTPNASAALVWGLMCDGNHSEAEKVAATVAHEMRLAPVQEFGVTLFWLQALAQSWTVIYWKLMCEVEQIKMALVAGSSDADGVAPLRSLRATEGRLLACDEALDNAACNHGFDSDTVRNIAQAVRYEPIVPDAMSDTEFELELLRAITTKAT